jgi:hypothetical protein
MFQTILRPIPQKSSRSVLFCGREAIEGAGACSVEAASNAQTATKPGDPPWKSARPVM